MKGLHRLGKFHSMKRGMTLTVTAVGVNFFRVTGDGFTPFTMTGRELDDMLASGGFKKVGQ